MTEQRKVGVWASLYHLFLVCTALLPFVSLFWQINFLNVKLNWILYPFLILGCLLSIFLRQKTPASFFLLLVYTVFYLALALFSKGDTETILRFFISFIPLTFLSVFASIELPEKKYFWYLFGASFSLPVYYAYLQYVGKMPYYDFDYLNDEAIGRISGGYNKPMNFIVFLFPVYLYGLYSWKVKGKKMMGFLILGIILIVLNIIGHRTSLLAFIVILLSSFSPQSTINLTVFYYRYFLNFFVGISSFIFFAGLYKAVGVVDMLRGRVPMWEAHSLQFFGSGFNEILFGRQQVLLQNEYARLPVDVIGEVHNNSFRTILVFGVLGFFIYCYFVRSLVLRVHRENFDPRLKFVVFSSFTFFMLYSITNEPIYYSGVLWPILIWIFLALQKRSLRSKIKN